METTEVKEKFIELRAKGYSFDKIAKELGRAKQTLIDWSRELQDEIANYKAMELEVLYEKYYLLKKDRLKSFAEVLQKIKKELDRRDLKDVATDKLLDIYTKYNSLLEVEYIEPVFKSSSEIQEDKESRELLGEPTGAEERKLKVVY